MPIDSHAIKELSDIGAVGVAIGMMWLNWWLFQRILDREKRHCADVLELAQTWQRQVVGLVESTNRVISENAEAIRLSATSIANVGQRMDQASIQLEKLTERLITRPCMHDRPQRAGE